MTNTSARIQEHISNFTAGMNALIRQAVIESVSNAVGGEIAPAPKTNGRRARVARAAPAAKATNGGDRAKGEKRSQEEIETTAGAAAAFIQKNPGASMEQISKELGKETSELALPMKRLLSEKRVSKKGEKRGTKYFAKA